MGLMKLELNKDSLYFLSQTRDEEVFLFHLSDDPGRSLAFIEKTGVKSFGYQAKDARTEAPNRIYVNPIFRDSVVKFMNSSGFKIEN